MFSPSPLKNVHTLLIYYQVLKEINILADLQKLEQKLGEVLGLEMAAQKAG
jgi:hypothetical protein